MVAHTLRSVLFPALTGASLLLSGCVVPGYPYAYGGPPPPGVVAVSPQGPAGVIAPMTVPSYPYAQPQVIVAPTFYTGYGWGYWYGNRYWPYRQNCGFRGGRYYNGYRWNGYRPGIQGAPYPYHGAYQGGYHGGYQGQGGWSR